MTGKELYRNEIYPPTYCKRWIFNEGNSPETRAGYASDANSHVHNVRVCNDRIQQYMKVLDFGSSIDQE